ncbi:hypothetical protein M8J76_010413 [Diaphorina citri]|nr:hypothetical protein M8J76_010413 [Diaphorina citri]
MFYCTDCSASYTFKSGLNKHRRQKHAAPECVDNNNNNNHMFCYICKKQFAYTDQLRSHLTKEHNISLEVQKLSFKSLLEFEAWRTQLEHADNIRYVQANGTKRGKDKDNIYLRCHRTGVYKRKGKETSKDLKSQGTWKINNHCTSSMIVEHFKTLDNVVKVTFFKDHFGHDIELEHLPLSKLDRDLIAGKLLQGVPADTVLDQVRDSIKGTCERIHLISKRQIQRIEQCIGLTSSVQRDENDLTSVAMFVEESKDSTENVVILYKNQGEVHPVLDKQDFVLGIMSKAQEAMLKKFGTNGIICMDSTHGTNPYDFNLITVLTVDDFGEGFPVAFLYANKEDETTLSLFLNSIKEKIGTINASTFMSDDAPQYYNSWKNVMGSTAKKLLCTWHVDRAWQGKINLIAAKDKKIVVYRMLKKLQTETCKEKFVVLLQEFLQMLGQDKDLSNFREYFETYYLNRVENWAYCHRLFSNINTNMYLEAMHRVIKHVYMKAQKRSGFNKRKSSNVPQPYKLPSANVPQPDTTGKVFT